MKREVLTYNEVQGFHYYPDAPNNVGYLSQEHRHIFVIKCRAEVSHNNREIEIITEQDLISKKLAQEFGNPCKFGIMSCESIAEWLLNTFPELTSAEILEDGYGGASLTR